jgi:hypothetical protein
VTSLIVLSLVGVLLTWHGYQILYRKRYTLIAGYHPERTKHPVAIARMLGPILLIGGTCLFLPGVGSYLLPTLAPWATIASYVPVGMLVALIPGLIKLNHDLKKLARSEGPAVIESRVSK